MTPKCAILPKNMNKCDDTAGFKNWCNVVEERIGNHFCSVITGQSTNLAIGIKATSDIVLKHYTSEEHVARVLCKLGKTGAANLILSKLPTTKNIRSGDLGEIYATEWIDAHSNGYRAPIKRLRWKDHRNMSMRGEDVIAIMQDQHTQRLHFLKTEAKSRAKLTNQVVSEARANLDNNSGLPSSHALTFISERLIELGNHDLADAIDKEILKYGIPHSNVKHLLFTFSGNSPKTLLNSSLQNYSGSINQLGVGLYIQEHGTFIANIYNQVIKSANNL